MNTILNQSNRHRVFTNRLNREDIQLVAPLESESSPTPAGKALPHSFPKTKFRRERARSTCSICGGIRGRGPTFYRTYFHTQRPWMGAKLYFAKWYNGLDQKMFAGCWQRKPLLGPAWEAEASTNKRGTREGSLYHLTRLFCSREGLVSTTGTFARVQLLRFDVVFLAARVRKVQPSYRLCKAAGCSTKGKILGYGAPQPLLVAIGKESRC